MTFVAPQDSRELTVRARGMSLQGESIETAEAALQVVPAEGLTVTGRVVDARDQPVSGASVWIRANGLVAEGFELGVIDRLPFLTGRMPDRRALLSSPAVRNPQRILGNDPFGLGLDPDFAARLTGELLVPRSGRYRFSLTGYAGARLVVNGQTVVEVVGQQASSVFATGDVTLDSGYAPVQIDYFDDVGPAALVITWVGPDGVERPLESQSLWSDVTWLRATTDAQGQFEIRDVPSMLAGFRIGIAAGVTGAESQSIAFSDGDVVTRHIDVGLIVLEP